MKISRTEIEPGTRVHYASDPTDTGTVVSTDVGSTRRGVDSHTPVHTVRWDRGGEVDDIRYTTDEIREID